MIKRLLAGLALRAISPDDPVIDVEYSQNSDEGIWRAKFSLSGSDREWKTTVAFKEGFEAELDPELPSEFVPSQSHYATPYVLKRESPVEILIRSKNLKRVSGLVFVTFEAKGRIGGTGLPRWVPIGLADPALLRRYDTSVLRNRASGASSHEG